MGTGKKVGGNWLAATVAATYMAGAFFVGVHPPEGAPPSPVTILGVYEGNWSKHMTKGEEERQSLDPQNKEETQWLDAKEYVLDLKIEHDDKQAA